VEEIKKTTLLGYEQWLVAIIIMERLARHGREWLKRHRRMGAARDGSHRRLRYDAARRGLELLEGIIAALGGAQPCGGAGGAPERG